MLTNTALNINFKVAKEEDVDSLASMCLSWSDAMGYGLSKEEIADDILRTVKSGVVIMAVFENNKPVGMMSGVISYHFWIKQKWAHEHWFFVLPEFRKLKIADKLQEAFCVWAKAKECSSVVITPNKFGSNEPEIISKALQNRGYTLHGYTLRREL